MVRPLVLLSLVHVFNWHSRLFDYAHSYFDLASFPDGETKRALQRIVNKRAGKAAGRTDNDGRVVKKQKKK